MNLAQLTDKLDELARNQCIFARKPWTPNSEAVAAPLERDFRVPPDLSARGFAYFLEMPLTREVLEVFGDRPPSKKEKLDLLIFYAENDAYPDWVCKR
ncbi:MAG TPA: hypothetical protein VHL11_18210 [Phototrophicaceae bacterium]|nr:hypothetical protein [Phototrophicaceae bacterium]